ncbi:hypothetical protein, partial [Mycolicibacterium sp.]|uniref:hypothetical protein n=1 Tax=Mycolicibacterium sp. TaxID=2320850 RepID=UPI003D11962F
MYSFRNRMILSAEVSSPYDINRFALSDDGADELVEIHGPEGDTNLWGAMELRLRGSGYPTREAAIDAGRYWRDVITIAFAHYDRGIELGSGDTPDMPHYSYGRFELPTHKGRKMRDLPKLVAFPTDQEPDYGNWHMSFAPHPQAIEAIYADSIAWIKKRKNWQLDDKQRLAYQFVHGSLFESEPESVYILLFTGIEALIPKALRKAEIVKVLGQLRSNLATMTDLDESARDSVNQLLQYKENESIRYRGRNFVKILDDALYEEELFAEKAPEQFFLDAYNTRNKLAHANVNRPAADELKEQIPELRRYLLALLDISIFGERVPDMWYGWPGDLLDDDGTP